MTRWALRCPDAAVTVSGCRRNMHLVEVIFYVQDRSRSK